MSDMPATLSLVLVLLAAIVLAIALLRLTIWSDEGSRPLSLVLWLSVAAVATTWPVWDLQVDPSLAPLFGENASDLIHVLFLVARNWLIGMIALYVLDVRARAWTALILAIALALIITSRAGHASQIPVRDEWELRDGTSVAYNVLYALTVGMTCVLVIAAVAVAVRAQRGIRRGPLIALGGVGVIGVAYSVTTITLLIVAPNVLRDNAVAIITAWSVPLNIALASAGLYGLTKPHTQAGSQM